MRHFRNCIQRGRNCIQGVRRREQYEARLRYSSTSKRSLQETTPSKPRNRRTNKRHDLNQLASCIEVTVRPTSQNIQADVPSTTPQSDNLCRTICVGQTGPYLTSGSLCISGVSQSPTRPFPHPNTSGKVVRYLTTEDGAQPHEAGKYRQ
ncbi:hypothetical protein M758_10G069200 [Ceratodon purpureus]|nr:hypothetical protein M758_10G069200 [Ceratodon purpureus]